MKRSLSLAVELLLKLGSCLAACIGCAPKTPPDPEQPGVIRWKGQITGYNNTTAERPPDHGGAADQK